MHEFKAGQEVRVKIEELRDYKVKVPEGTVGTFDHYDLGNRWGLVRFPGYVGDGPDGLVKTWDKELEAVQPGPQWSDVEVGDKVKVRLKATGQEVDTEAYHEPPEGTDYVRVLGYTTHAMGPAKYELLSIEKPKPQPPTTPGSHVTVPHPYWESGINHLFLLDDGKWASQTGLAFWAAEDVASKDFTVIHDAGASS